MRNAPRVAANAAGLLPVANETTRKKKISYDSEIQPPAHASASTTGNEAMTQKAGVCRGTSGDDCRISLRPYRRSAMIAPSATAILMAAAT
jgi:hypothetical protein